MKSPRISPSHALATLDRLEATYPEAHCALTHQNPWQLLVATILSAQCTDVRVNLVTPQLFARFPDPASLANAALAEVEELIRSTGFFRNKAKSLVGCAAALVRLHNGRVPQTLPALVALPGVGRKTANVVLGNAFAVPGMVVDTHVGRIARRLGWTTARTPEGVEEQLCKLLPSGRWTQTAHVLIFHGRQCCRAQTAWCSACPVVERCPQVGVGRQK
ncbi:MAG: endonuclease III [Desulfuromonadales bacterium]|nr:endonuclease III [Desulfuromonadales bacterium]